MGDVEEDLKQLSKNVELTKQQLGKSYVSECKHENVCDECLRCRTCGLQFTPNTLVREAINYE